MRSDSPSKVVGRLKQVTDRDGADQVVMDIHYVHDALGRRIGKLRGGNLEKGWLYADALNPIAQLDSSGNIEATFIYGSRAHVSDAMVMTNGTVYRLISNHLGSVRLVVNAETGEVVQRMDYDAFGRVLSDDNPGFQPFGFAGGLYDDDTGLVRFGARDYDAHSGRWTAKDPTLFVGGPNFYAYANLDPINFVDLTGRSPVHVVFLIVVFASYAVAVPNHDAESLPGMLAPFAGEGAAQGAKAAIAKVFCRSGIQKAALNQIIRNSAGIREAIEALNQAGASQQQAIQVISQVLGKTGRSVGAIVEGPGGAKIMTGVVPGVNQHIVQVAANGSARLGSATVDLGLDAAGNFTATVTNVALP